jgi:predicted nucleic acid-binding Zn ribbon protein
MPTYTFKNTETGEEQDIILRMSQVDEFKESNPHLTQVISGGQGLVRNSGSVKPDSGFRDVLKSIKKASGKGNTINDF